MDEIIAWLTENMSAEKVAIAGQFLVSGGALTWAVGIYNKFKKQRVQTPNEIAGKVDSQVKTSVKESLSGSLNPLKAELDQIKAQNKVLAESMALLASNTPESRLALLTNISKIESASEIVIQATEDVKNEIKEEAEQEKKVDEAIAELEKPVEFL
jgi:hypothetical protein